MKVGVFGLGYVGFTSMCCIAKEGHSVVGFEVNERKVEQILNGIPPITEPEVKELLKEGIDRNLISAYSEIGDRLADIDLAIVCVGTPSEHDGSHNLTYIAEVTRQIASAVSRDRATSITVAYRSTIRPGTITGLIEPIFRAELGNKFEVLVKIVYNPEFLRESSAVKDYLSPPKIVVGTCDGRPNEKLEILNRNIDAPTFYVGYGESELTKFVDNTWHAAKVAYANEIGRVCVQLGLSVSKISEIFLSDTKLNISAYYMRPGGAFGGSCLPKDVRALQHLSAECGANTPLINSLLSSNNAHKFRLQQLATNGLAPGSSILLVGIAFKADTDDLRESPNVDLARGLLNSGYRLSIYDPAIEAEKLIGANLGYAWSHLPQLTNLLVSREQAQKNRYTRIIVANRFAQNLDLLDGQDVVDINQLA